MGEPKEDVELNNFLSRVDEISRIIQGLSSDEAKDQERAIRKADILLHDGSGEGKFSGDLLDDSSTNVTTDRTIINPQKGGTGGEGEPTPDAFMKYVEKDANERAKDREERKKKADQLRAKGNEAFKSENYALALDSFNKAIDLIRDSPCLYTNRALTYIRVGVPSKSLQDLDQALELNPNSLKARLLKARAWFNLSDPETCRDWLKETKELFPEQIPMISRYEEDLFELNMELNRAYNGERGSKAKPPKKKGSFKGGLKSRLHDITEPETIWLQAARGELADEED